MFLSVKEMELLCVFYDGSLSSTLALLMHAQCRGECPPGRVSDLDGLVDKLSQMKDGEFVCLAFNEG